MTLSFTEAPILNSPYEKPGKHWELRIRRAALGLARARQPHRAGSHPVFHSRRAHNEGHGPLPRGTLHGQRRASAGDEFVPGVTESLAGSMDELEDTKKRYLFGIFRVSWTRPALPILLGAFVVGLAISCSTETVEESNPTVETIHDLPVQGSAEGHEVGQQSPEFTLRLANGETLTLTQIRDSGRPTFLFFWATT